MQQPDGLAAALLRASSRAYAAATLRGLRQLEPGSATTALPATFADPLADTEVRILQLAESLAVRQPVLLAEVLRWYRIAFAHRDVPESWLPANLAALRATLATELPATCAGAAVAHLDAATAGLEGWPTSEPVRPAVAGPLLEAMRRYLLAILEGRVDEALAVVRQALATGVDVAEVHDGLLTAAQREIGRMWLHGEIPIADEHHGTVVSSRALDLVHERIPAAPADGPRALVFGVGGNLHELGLRVVAQRLQLDGWQVVNLGGNLPADDLDWFFADRSVDLVAMSATMLLHLGAARQAVARVRALAPAVPVLLGGEPFRLCPGLHLELGADASAADADGAVAQARRLCPGHRGRSR